MKATGQKLKKLKTRQVYGFKKDQVALVGAETTSTQSTSGIFLRN
jgi:hypothetical protein